MEFDELSRNVIGCAIEVHRNLGPGLLESTYRQCLACELSHADIAFQMEVQLPVRYKGLLLDCGYRIDLLIRRDLIVEIKSVETLSSNSPSANSYLHATRQCFAWLANQFQRHKAPKRHQTFRSVVLRDLRGSQELTGLFLHRPERQHNFAEQFIEHLREAGVDRGETAEDSFVASCVFKALARTGKIADGEHKEQNRQRGKHDL